MCQALDPTRPPRKIKDFNADEVFPGGKVIEHEGDWWIELLKRVTVAEARKVLNRA
jgi:hypothetical protein